MKLSYKFLLGALGLIVLMTSLYFIFEARQVQRERVMIDALQVQLVKTIESTNCPPDAKTQVEATLEAAKRALANGGTVINRD